MLNKPKNVVGYFTFFIDSDTPTCPFNILIFFMDPNSARAPLSTKLFYSITWMQGMGFPIGRAARRRWQLTAG